MKPAIHAQLSTKRHGGTFDDYMFIHDYLDQTKSAQPAMSHRVVLHNAFGIYIVEDRFGQTFENSDGAIVSVRDICEEHIIEDLGFIPTLEQCLAPITAENSAWLWGRPKSSRIIKMVD